MGSRLLARVLLAVMLATFLSPGFAWHMNADHRAVVDHPHDHEDGPVHTHGDDSQTDAHTSIGHLLGHLSMQVAQRPASIPVPRADSPLGELWVPPPVSGSSPPYKPPL